MVRKRRKPDPPEVASNDDEFFKDMAELLDDEEHMDTVFHVPQETGVKGEASAELSKSENVVQIRAHKCILTARAEYFKALFRKGATPTGGPNSGVAFKESTECVIRVDSEFSSYHVRTTLEFLYTNRIRNLTKISTDDLLCLLHLSDKWLLRDMKRVVEHELIRHHMEVNTVARMYCATEDFRAQRLSRACIDFIMANIRQVTGNATFQEEMRNYPHLCIPILKAAADLIPEGPLPKKQRTEVTTTTTTATPTGGLSSSPVPDSDP
eukprot:CAMPEP_0116541990 /NCGR_PEP_ID=MMETSP0397-20121206/774_1 /TAXON_ID=216820 /ORGANISM="Cyclophora tenuis, Strain ECT3854" /LENGTH=266 /DNA_ID=CAMNT_0004065963 /DNA_START=229 /DNA_END=1029 /DNA_ORIENTATION=-